MNISLRQFAITQGAPYIPAAYTAADFLVFVPTNERVAFDETLAIFTFYASSALQLKYRTLRA